MPFYQNNPDANFVNINIPFKELKEDTDKKENDEASKEDTNKSDVKVAEKIPYSGYMNLGWIVGTIYIFIVIIHLIVNDNFPQNYLEFCNDKDIMAIDEYKMLKKDIAYIEEEINGINITIRHQLFEEQESSILLKKLLKYSEKIKSLNSTLNLQTEKHFNCYKACAEKYLNENPNIFFNTSSILCALAFMVSFYYSVKIMFNKPSTKRIVVAITMILSSGIFFFIDALLFLFALMDAQERRILRTFPLNKT